jgi:hypothetical protein
VNSVDECQSLASMDVEPVTSAMLFGPVAGSPMGLDRARRDLEGLSCNEDKVDRGGLRLRSQSLASLR